MVAQSNGNECLVSPPTSSYTLLQWQICTRRQGHFGPSASFIHHAVKVQGICRTEKCFQRFICFNASAAAVFCLTKASVEQHCHVTNSGTICELWLVGCFTDKEITWCLTIKVNDKPLETLFCSSDLNDASILCKWQNLRRGQELPRAMYSTLARSKN